METEISHLRRTFRANGYPARLINKGLSQPKSSQPAEEEGTSGGRQKLFYLPYVQHTSKHIRVCSQIGVKVVFKLRVTFRETLMRVKTSRPKLVKKGIVYKIPCKDCTLERQKGTYRKEHKTVVKRRHKEWCSSAHMGTTTLGRLGRS